MGVFAELFTARNYKWTEAMWFLEGAADRLLIVSSNNLRMIWKMKKMSDEKNVIIEILHRFEKAK